MGFHLGCGNLVSRERFDRSFGEGFYVLKAVEYYYILARLFYYFCIKKLF